VRQETLSVAYVCGIIARLAHHITSDQWHTQEFLGVDYARNRSFFGGRGGSTN
jgi:hypothetical protein